MFATIIAFSNIVASLTNDNTVKGYFRQIKNAAENISKLTRNFLSLERKQTLYLEKIRFDDFMNDLFVMLKRFTNEDVEFGLELEDILPYVKNRFWTIYPGNY